MIFFFASGCKHTYMTTKVNILKCCVEALEWCMQLSRGCERRLDREIQHARSHPPPWYHSQLASEPSFTVGPNYLFRCIRVRSWKEKGVGRKGGGERRYCRQVMVPGTSLLFYGSSPSFLLSLPPSFLPLSLSPSLPPAEIVQLLPLPHYAPRLANLPFLWTFKKSSDVIDIFFPCRMKGLLASSDEEHYWR